MTHLAIPTTYAGQQFRSRLEATWAAFFDLAHWPTWTYEPFDLHGWTPDFHIASPRYPGGILIEIKPATTTTDLISRAEKAFNHAGTATVLALGAVTTLQGGTAAPYPAGMGHTITPCVSPAEMGAWKERGTTWWLRCIDCNRLAYFNSNAVQPQCALCSAPTHGTARIMDLARDMDLDYHPARHAARLWHEAQNATMARKPRPRT